MQAVFLAHRRSNKFDLLGRTLYSVSCDAGAKRSFSNVVGNPIRVWDSRDYVIRSVYDFKGNLLEPHRQFPAAFSGQLDWSQSVALEAETFVQTTQYDALNRSTSMEMPYAPNTPDKPNNIVKPFYNEPGLLERVEAFVRGAATETICWCEVTGAFGAELPINKELNSSTPRKWYGPWRVFCTADDRVSSSFFPRGIDDCDAFTEVVHGAGHCGNNLMLHGKCTKCTSQK